MSYQTPYKVSRIETISKHCIDIQRIGYVECIPESYRLNVGNILFSNINSIPLQEGTYDKEKFVATLKGKGIDTVLRYTEEGRIYGTTFIDHRTGCVLNGSRMGKELSANALQEHFTLPYAGQPPISLSVPVEEPENRQGYSDSKNVMLWYIIDV